MRHVRWCIRSWQTSPPMKWWTNADSHASFTKTDFSSCQKLTFPFVWVSTKHVTDVPAPPQLSQLPKGVTVRLCHEWIVVWWTPSTSPVRLPWCGLKGSYNADWKVALYPHSIKQEETPTVLNQTTNQMRTCTQMCARQSKQQAETLKTVI